MRRFKFRFETVMRHREIIESLREQDFATAQGQVQMLEFRMTVLEEEMRLVMTGRQGGRAGESFDASDALNRERYLVTLQYGVSQLQRHLSAAQVVAEETRRALVAARQAREAVSKLREQDLSEYTALGLKLEQETLDEMAGLRHNHARAISDIMEQKEVASHGEQH